MSSKKRNHKIDDWSKANRWFSYLEGKIANLNKKTINNETEIRKQRNELKRTRIALSFVLFILSILIFFHF